MPTHHICACVCVFDYIIAWRFPRYRHFVRETPLVYFPHKGINVGFGVFVDVCANEMLNKNLSCRWFETPWLCAYIHIYTERGSRQFQIEIGSIILSSCVECNCNSHRMKSLHGYVFPHYWPVVRGKRSITTEFLTQRVSGAEIWDFLRCQLQQTADLILVIKANYDGLTYSWRHCNEKFNRTGQMVHMDMHLDTSTKFGINPSCIWFKCVTDRTERCTGEGTKPCQYPAIRNSEGHQLCHGKREKMIKSNYVSWTDIRSYLDLACLYKQWKVDYVES